MGLCASDTGRIHLHWARNQRAVSTDLLIESECRRIPWRNTSSPPSAVNMPRQPGALRCEPLKAASMSGVAKAAPVMLAHLMGGGSLPHAQLFQMLVFLFLVADVLYVRAGALRKNSPPMNRKSRIRPKKISDDPETGAHSRRGRGSDGSNSDAPLWTIRPCQWLHRRNLITSRAVTRIPTRLPLHFGADL